MTSVLQGLDVEILTAASGEEALGLMLRHSFAVVLLDVQMPGLDGFETAEFIREHDETRATPIIFVTAIDKDERHVFRGYEAGAVDYLFKPIEPAILVSKVQVFLDLFRHREELRRALAQLERANDDLDRFAYALRGLVGRSGHDRTANDDSGPFMNAEEMARRLRAFLRQRSARVSSDEGLDATGEVREAPLTRVHFLDEWYEIDGFRAPVLEVLMASMEDVVILGRHVAEVHEELRREIKERRRAEQASRAASEAKSRFLGNMSHELRTPLNAIIGLSRLILDAEQSGGFDAGIAEDVRLIHESGGFLLRLIERLMDRSQIELGRVTLDIDVVDIFELARNVTASLVPFARERHNTLTFECAEDIGTLCTDSVKLRQILHNLIVNACKFTHDGEIHLFVSRQQCAQSECVLFRVRDTGIGIAPARQHEIFEDFKQLDSSDTRRYDGLGLGLAICKHYCELMGARISVQSAPGQGSIFTVWIPVDDRLSQGEHRVET